MRITKRLVREFEETQKNHGTYSAIHNILWTLSFEILKDIGVKGVKTFYRASQKGLAQTSKELKT